LTSPEALIIFANVSLEPNRRCYKAKTAMLEDPVKISEIKARKEASMLGTSTKVILPQQKTLGKDTIC
jgi:hypothetical protein